MRANLLVQVLALAAAPLLTRLYSAEDFGAFGLFSATAVIVTSVATARVDWLMPNARSPATGAALFVVGLCAVALTTAVVILLVVLDPPFLTSITTGLGPLVWCVPLVMVLLGLVELFSGWYVRQGDLRSVSIAKIGQGLANVGASVIGGLSRLGGAGLIVAYAVAAAVNVALLARYGADLWRHMLRTTRQRLVLVLRRFHRQALMSTAVSLTNAISASITVILIAQWFGLQEVGWYALMLRLAIAPISLVASAIGQSFWALAAEMARERRYVELRAAYLRTTGRLALLSIPILIACGLAPLVVGPIFGEAEWAPAGYVLLAMAPHLLGTAIFSPTNHLVVYDRQQYQLLSDFLAIGLAALSVWLSAQWGLGIVICTLLVSCAMLLGYLVRFAFHLHANRALSHGA